MSDFVLSQIFVGFAICSDLISFQFKKRSWILCCLLLSCTLISIHFMLLGHWTAASLALLAAARFITSLFTTSRFALTFFLLASLSITAFTYEGILSILGVTGAMFGTTATFCKDDKRLRELMMICTSIWMIHNIIANSPGAVFMELIFISSNIIGYFRYYIRPARQAFSSVE